MKKNLFVALIIFVIALAFVAPATALSPYAVDHDTYLNGASTNHNNEGFLRISSTGGFGCAPTSSAYLQIDMTKIVQNTDHYQIFLKFTEKSNRWIKSEKVYNAFSSSRKCSLW